MGNPYVLADSIEAQKEALGEAFAAYCEANEVDGTTDDWADFLAARGLDNGPVGKPYAQPDERFPEPF